MLRKTLYFFVFSVSSVLACAAAENIIEVKKADAVANTNTFNKQVAVIFSKKSPNLTVKKAYSLQKAFVKNSVAKGVDIVGFKAGLTTRESAKAYGLEESISGVMLQAPLRGAKGVVSTKDTVNLMLEQEFAFQIAKPVNEKITEDQLMEYVAAVAPAIEIPQVNFLSKDYNGLDMIANNAMAYKVMIGDWQKPVAMSVLDATTVSFSCNGQVLSTGQGSNAMQGQAKALLWLVNHMVDQGYKIQKGQILITGNLIKLIPAKPCVYQGDFGKLGKLELLVTD